MQEGDLRAADLVGRSLGHFRVTGKLGEGAMGVVYRATDENLGRDVALKVLPPDFAADAERRARFLREARSAAAVSHANIATIYEVGEADERVFIAMELVVGRTLRDILTADGRPPLRDVLRWAKGIARAVAKAHAKGIVHRDLKPDNVMIDGEGQVKVLDFGIAKEVVPAAPPAGAPASAPLTQAGTVIGTPDYMSPEQARGEAVDLRSDVFSLGAVFYEMLVGRPPFMADSMIGVLIAVTRDEPQPIGDVVRDVPRGVVEIVERCLKKDPSARFASGRELLEALRALDPVGRPDPKPTVKAAPPSARTRKTVPPAARAPKADDAAKALAPRWPRVAALGLVAVAVVVAGGLGIAKLRKGSGGAAAAASSAAHPPPAPTAIGAGPAPKTANPQAAEAYTAAIQAMRNAELSLAEEQLARALHLDPNLAAADLLLALEPAFSATPSAARHFYEAASRLRASLSERDQALLSLAEVRAAEEDDPPEAASRAKTLGARFPGDAYVAVLEAEADARAGLQKDADVAFARAKELDPKAGYPLWAEAFAHELAKDDDGAMKAYAECSHVVPAASSCLRGRLRLLDRKGECKDLESAARGVMKLEPDASVGYFWLARALAGQGASVASVKDAMGEQRKRSDESGARKHVLDLAEAWQLDALGGDLGAAESASADWLAAVSGETNERALGPPYEVAMETALEVGDDAKAVSIARALVDHPPKWTPSDRRAAWAEALGILHRAHKLGDADFTKQRDDAAKDARPGVEPSRIWLDLYATPAQTKAEAFDAMQARGSFGSGRMPDEVEPSEAEAFGRVLYLTGNVVESRKWLRRAVETCSAALDPLRYARVHDTLGHTFEDAREKDFACKEYQTVIDRWGGAKPRSITAEDASARMAALQCPR